MGEGGGSESDEQEQPEDERFQQPPGSGCLDNTHVHNNSNKRRELLPGQHTCTQ